MNNTRQETNYLIVHCSATQPQADPSILEIDRWHRQRGIASPRQTLTGYHAVIRRDGSIQIGRDPDEIGAHALGHNDDSIGVCLIGGVDRDLNAESNYSMSQWRSLINVIRIAQAIYPKIKTIGHNEVSNKACPSFNVQSALHIFGLGEKNENPKTNTA